MLVTPDELSSYCKRWPDGDIEGSDLREIYIGAAGNVIDNYVGYSVEERYSVVDTGTGDTVPVVPPVFRLVCLQIATLMYMTENSNIGFQSSGAEGGYSRVPLNVIDYTKYLSNLSSYREVQSDIPADDAGVAG